MWPRLSRAVDAYIDRGEGLDGVSDPFGRPLAPEEVGRLLHTIRAARFHDVSWTSPLPPPESAVEVPPLLAPPREGNRWAIFVPQYGSLDAKGRHGINSIHAAALRRQGFGVATVCMPFHGPRALRGHPSGWGFVRADLGHTARTLAAAAAETVAVMRHLRDFEGAETLVGLGISLGGAALGLAAACGGPVDAATFLAAVDNPASFYATGEKRAARRETLAAAGFDDAGVEASFRPFSPSTYASPVPREALTFVIPRNDLLVPPAGQEAWRVAWGGQRLELPEHGHATSIGDPFIAARLARRLKATADTMASV